MSCGNVYLPRYAAEFVICSQRFTESGFVMEDTQRALHFTFHCLIVIPCSVTCSDTVPLHDLSQPKLQYILVAVS